MVFTMCLRDVIAFLSTILLSKMKVIFYETQGDSMIAASTDDRKIDKFILLILAY